jgi:hypothetical protein
VGSESAPVEIGLSTDPPGIPYDAGTGSITLAGDQTSLLGGTCSDPGYTSILNSPIFGAGHNQVRLSGTLDRGVNGGLPQNASGNPCAVPKLRAMRLAAARRALKAAGCRPGHLTRRASRAKRGTVIGQSSRAGTLLPAGARVALVVSKGVH